MNRNFILVFYVKLIQLEMGKKTREEEEENYKDTRKKNGNDRAFCSTISLKHICLLSRMFETSTDACFPG